MFEWESEAHLLDHFEGHGHEVGAATVEAFDASARETLAHGTIFSYVDRATGERRIGHYDRPSGRFAALNDDQRIVTHFRCTEGYVRGLPGSTYR